MNVVFLSPGFPPQFFQFCTALRERGVNVLGVGDQPYDTLRPELRAALSEYFFEPRLEDYDAALRAVGYLVWKHGRIDRIDSHTEHWLGIEARLREDFNIPGPRIEEMHRGRTKSGMAELFRAAKVPCPAGALFESPAQARAFAKKHGYPLVFKPDLGVGAARTFKVGSASELEEALKTPLDGYIMQPFVQGVITSYDGIVDRDGRIVFEISHVYNSGVMEVVQGGLDLYYWSRREIPAELRELGRKAVAGFGLRERFFHIEFFEQPDGKFVALEINIRPPGGFTTDMMNYAADVDVYRLWARALTGDPTLADFTYERRHFVAHASRRWSRRYRYDHAQLARELGPSLQLHREMPRAFAGAMGDEMYLLRDPDFPTLEAHVRLIQAPA